MSANLVLMPTRPKTAVSPVVGMSVPQVERLTPVARPAEVVEQVRTLLKWVETASADKRHQLENQLVAMGPMAVAPLVDALVEGSAAVQAMAVMVLLRQGKTACKLVNAFCREYRDQADSSLQPVAFLLAHQFGI